MSKDHFKPSRKAPAPLISLTVPNIHAFGTNNLITHTHLHKDTKLNMQIHTNSFFLSHTQTHTRVHTHTHTHTHVCSHIHTHMHKDTQKLGTFSLMHTCTLSNMQEHAQFNAQLVRNHT